jgi:hypothetical protein
VLLPLLRQLLLLPWLLLPLHVLLQLTHSLLAQLLRPLLLLLLLLLQLLVASLLLRVLLLLLVCQRP